MYKTEMHYSADNKLNMHGASVHFCRPQLQYVWSTHIKSELLERNSAVLLWDTVPYIQAHMYHIHIIC